MGINCEVCDKLAERIIEQGNNFLWHLSNQEFQHSRKVKLPDGFVAIFPLHLSKELPVELL